MRLDEPEIRKRPKKEESSLSWHLVDVNTAWLNGEHVWSGDKVCFKYKGSIIVPSPNQLARAQRQLYRLIETKDKSSKLRFEDFDTWRLDRLKKLEYAKLVSTISLEQPFDQIVSEARKGKRSALESLTKLLIAEALVFTELPFSPSRAFLSIPHGAEAQLHGLCKNNEMLANARMLAALLLGAITKANSSQKQFSFEEENLRRAFYWGLKNGAGRDDAFICRFLQERDGLDLAGRAYNSSATLKHLKVEREIFLNILASGTSVETVVELVEGLAALEPLYVELYRLRFNDMDLSWDEERRKERQAFAAGWKKIFFEIMLECRDPQALLLAMSLTQSLLTDYEPNEELLAGLRNLLNFADFSPLLYVSYLTLLDKHCSGMMQDVQALADSFEGHGINVFWGQYAWHIRTLLLSCADVSLVDEVILSGQYTYRDFSKVEWQSAAELRAAWALYKKDDDLLHNLPALQSVLSRFDDLNQGRQQIDSLLSSIPLNDAKTYNTGQVLQFFAGRKNSTKEILKLQPVFTAFLKSAMLCCGGNQFHELIYISALVPHAYIEWLNWLYAEFRESMERDAERNLHALRSELRVVALLSAALSEGSFLRFKALVYCLMECDLTSSTLLELNSVERLRYMPALRFALRVMLPLEPKRALRLLNSISLIQKVCKDPLNNLEVLKPFLEDWNATHASADWLMDEAEEQCWQGLLAVDSELGKLASAYKSTLEQDNSPLRLPNSIMKELNYQAALLRELQFLESIASSDGPTDCGGRDMPGNGRDGLGSGQDARAPGDMDLSISKSARIDKRILNLKARLSNPEKVYRFMLGKIKEKLEFHLADLLLNKVEALVLAAYSRRLGDIIGYDPQLESADDKLFYAALLWLGIEENRAVLRKLLKSHFKGETAWKMRQPENKKFICELEQLGMKMTVWLADNPISFPFPADSGQQIKLKMESDPLEILMMGSYFNTCLSFGGLNAFSTVANAVDVNKRVIYARDAAGKVIGRKLIAISTENTLLGYHTYCALSDASQRKDLQNIFLKYCTFIAKRVGLTLSNDGDVKVLCAEGWYDDGAVDWSASDLKESRYSIHKDFCQLFDS